MKALADFIVSGHFQAILVDRFHAVIEQRLDQADLGAEVILGRRRIFLTRGEVDLANRNTIDATLGEQLFGCQQYPGAGFFGCSVQGSISRF